MTSGTNDRLSVQGERSVLDLLSVGVSGSRKADPRSLRAAQRIGSMIAGCGLALSAGDARGVDETAQAGALSAGGRVVMVLPFGLHRWRKRAAYEDLLTGDNHAVVSEFAVDTDFTAPQAYQRNATIIERSLALVVVRADVRGGTWNAGLTCLRMERPLFVVRTPEGPAPGNVELIARGGTAIESPNALADDLRRIVAPFARPQVVHVREPHTVTIGRPSVWGNPFKIGEDGTRSDVIGLYREHLARRIAAGVDLTPLVGQTLG